VTRRGYLTHAFNTARADYVRMAYCLAASIKLTQSDVRDISVVVPSSSAVPQWYLWAFDQVISVPNLAVKYAHDPNWQVENYVRLYELSPYDETVTLDADMLLFDDVSTWWSELAGHDVVPATAVTYRGERIQHNPLRADLYRIGLPDLHNGFLYMRKGDAAEQLFSVMQRLTSSWSEACVRHFGRPDVHFSSDAALLLGLRETGLEDVCRGASRSGIPRFIHMKGCLQGWPRAPQSAREWRDHVEFSFDAQLRLTVGDVMIGDPFHYHVRDFISDHLLARYEALTSCGFNGLAGKADNG
jgi:hypothetical protein